MITKEIIDYVKDQVVKNKTKDEIKSSLLQNGWSELDVEEVFKYLNNNNSKMAGSGKQKSKLLKITFILFFVCTLTLGGWWIYKHNLIIQEENLVNNQKNVIKESLMQNKENISVAEMENKILSSEEFLEKFMLCENETNFTVIDEIPHPLFGKFKITVDVNLLKKSEGICQIIYSNFRDIVVKSPEGKIDTQISKDLQESYKNMKTTCLFNEKDRENIVQKAKEQNNGNFSINFNSEEQEKCIIEGLN